MPIQDYRIYTAKGYAGDRYDSAPSVTQSGRAEAATLGFGLGVKIGTDTNTHPPSILAGAVAGNIWGITMRELNHEATNRPSDGTTDYMMGESVSVMREGFLLVMVTGAADVAANGPMHMNQITGAFTGDAVAGDIIDVVNVTPLEKGSPGEIIKVRIDIIHA